MTPPTLLLSTGPSDVLERALWAIRGLPSDVLLARVESPNGELLLPGEWILAPKERSASSDLDWFRKQWGSAPAVDFKFSPADGSCSPFPLSSVAVEGNVVVLRGARGTARLWIEAWHGCTYSDIMWSHSKADSPDRG